MEEFIKNAAQALNGERFKLIIFPTEKCNFRCVYCYENHIGKRMNIELVESIKKFLVLKIPTIKLFELEWFGGEPLLAKDIVIEITSLAQKLCKEYGVTFVSVMTTNGYLLNVKTFSKLVELGINSYQITFDGDKDNHNKYRLLANKSSQGTFDKIWGNLCDIKSLNYNFSIAIRCHLTAINRASIESLLVKINEAFGDDNRFFIHLKEVSALGGKDDDKMCILSKDEKIALVNDLKDKYSYMRFVDIGKDYICYAARPNTFAIRADGTIAKCTVALDCNLNNVGRIMNDGTIDVDPRKFLLWSEGFDNMEKTKLDCPYYHVIRKLLINNK